MRSALFLACSSLIPALNPGFAFSDCTPQVLEPNGGESYVIGSIVTIRWQNPPGCPVSPAEILFSEDGGNHWFFVAQNVTGESYEWQTFQATLRGLIRVTVSGNGTDTSDGTFEVHGPVENSRFALHRKDAASFPTVFCDNPHTPAIEPNYSPNYPGLEEPKRTAR